MKKALFTEKNSITNYFKDIKSLIGFMGYIMIFLSPLMYYRFLTPFDFYLTFLRILLILIIFIFTIYTFLYGKFSLPNNKIISSISLYLIYMLIRVFDTPVFNHVIQKIVVFTINIITVFIIVNLFKDSEKIVKAIKVFIYGSIIPIIIGLYQMVQFYIFGKVGRLPFSTYLTFREGEHLNLEAFWYAKGGLIRVHSTLGSPNFFGEYLGLIIILCLPLLLLEKKMDKIISIITFLSIVLLFATFSISAWTSLFLSLIFIFCMISFFIKSLKRLRILKIAFLIFLIIFISLYVFPQEILINRLFEVFDLGNRNTAAHLRMRMNAVDMFLSNPLFGVSIGGYGFITGQKGMSIVHSEFLLELAEGGILGFTIFFYMTMSLFIVAYRSFKKSEFEKYKLFALGLLGCVFLIITNNTIFYNTFHRETNWIVFGLMLALARVNISRYLERKNLEDK